MNQLALEFENKSKLMFFAEILGFCLAIVAMGGLFAAILYALFFTSSNLSEVEVVMIGYFISLYITLIYLWNCILKVLEWREQQ
jgi:hypothetical protein